jgi:hypothetical protein
LKLTRSVLLTAVLAAALSAPAAQASEVSPAQAERTLEQAEALLGGEKTTLSSGAAAPGREATLVLQRLSNSFGALDPAERRRAQRLFARPGDGKFDTFGKEAKASPICDAQFCTHWTNKGIAAPPKADKSPANGIPDFVEEVAIAAAQSYAVENGTLGWNTPLPDGRKGSRNGKGTNGEVDIYLDNLGSGLFGYATTDRGGGKAQRKPGYLVLDNDYDGFQGVPLDLMRATMAHEYNHVVQFAYDLDLDGWMFESTATWMEDHVYPDINDYINFLSDTYRYPQAPLAEKERQAFKLYGSAVWNHYLTHLYGPEVVEAAWEAGPSVSPDDFAVAAYDQAIRDAGGLGFSEEFLGFAASTAEWRSTDVFPDPGLYKDVKRSGKLGAKGAKEKLDHTGYRLYKVDRPASGDVVLKARLEKGNRWGIALVGRAGPVIGGTVETAFTYSPNGGNATVTIPDAARFSRITAVVVNADGRVKGNSRKYRADARKFKLSLG